MVEPPLWSLGAHVDGESNIAEVPKLGYGRVEANAHSIPTVVEQLQQLQLRDSLISANSGRWMLGNPDPAVFVPGDVASVRGLTSSSALLHAYQMYTRARNYGRAGDRDQEAEGLRSAAFHSSVAKLILTSTPFFIPETMVEAVCASEPPDRDSVDAIRLPFPMVLVMFGRDVPLDPEIFDEVDLSAVPPEALLRQAAVLGAYLTGVVLIAEPDGAVADRFLWLLTSNPDPTQPYPANLDRIRGAVIGLRSRATMRGLVDTIAGVVTWAHWSPVPRSLDIAVDRIQKEARSGKFKRWEPSGGLVPKLRVISYQPSEPRESSEPHGGRRSPRQHTRRGHFRRVLVGEGVRSLPTEQREYQTRWIPPTLVNPGQGAGDRPVYRISPRRHYVRPGTSEGN
jgi:hypothetical protein